MLRVLKQAFKTGVLTNRFPAVQSVPSAESQGKPVIDFARCTSGEIPANACPTGAISFETRQDDSGTRRAELVLDYGKCIFCGECMLASPESIVRAPELPAATTMKSSLVNRASYQKDNDDQWQYVETVSRHGLETKEQKSLEALGAAVRDAAFKAFGRSLHIREVDAGSCNGCEIEITSLNNPVYDIERFGVHFVASPRHADMLLVTGPVTRNMEMALKQTYDATPSPKLVIAVGACGISGGIFGQSYASCGGVDTVVPVDVYIPGCPPGPEALLRGILLAIQRWPQKG
jgi:Ni,Fe-hydrogenase III small subunit/formate hydrogenlyase subunit 6/NADH:ubiquinone oxidoreductase subunit I